MARAVKINSVSGALTVTFTGPAGNTPTVYSNSALSATTSLPATVADGSSAAFWFASPGAYTLSVKTSGGTEIAADSNSTRVVDLEQDGAVQQLSYDTRGLAPVAGDSGRSAAIGSGTSVSDATVSSKGVVQLAGDLAGTAAAPTVPGLANKQAVVLPPSLPAGTSLAKVYNSALQAYNLSQSSLILARAALAGVRASDTQGPVFRILIAGDSRTQGTGSGTPLYNHNFGSKLRALLNNTFGLPATDGAVWATDAGPFDDARITQGTGWSVTLGMNSGRTPTQAVGFGGGGVFTATTSATGTLGFTPDANIGSSGTTDTLRVFYLTGPGYGTVTVKNGATTLGTINANNATYGQAVATFTAARGGNAYTLSAPTGGSFYCIGFEAWDSTTPCISVSNCGTSGSGSAYWNNTNAPYSAVQGSGGAWTLYKPNLTIVPLGVNDSNSTAAAYVSSSTYQTNLGQIVDQARTNSGDVILLGDYQSPATNQQPIQPYVAAAYAVADSKDVALFDLNSRWPAGGGTALGPSGYGLLQSDLVHPSPRGHFEIADGFAAVLRGFIIPTGIAAAPAGSGNVSSSSASATANQTLSTTDTTLNGLSVTITADGSSRWKVSAVVAISNGPAASGCNVKLKEGATVLAQTYQTVAASQYLSYPVLWVGTPSAGSHTYTLTGAMDSGGTGSTNANTTNPIFLIAEYVGA